MRGVFWRMKAMQIIFPRVNCAELVELGELPAPGEGEIQVRTAYSTISAGTERSNITGELNVKIESYSDVAEFPRSGGYSSSGVVLAVGRNVEGIQPGERVAMSWSKHMNVQNIGVGDVHPIEDERVTMQEAALTHIGTFPMAAIRKCALEMGEPAVVMGQGILGLMAVKLLRLGGAYPVIAVDPVEGRRRKTLEYGADAALDPFAPGFVETVKRLTHGGAKVAIEVTGNGKALDQALDVMAPFGRVALLGCTRHSDFSIDYYHKVHGPGITLLGAHTLARPVFESSARLWTTHDDAMAILRLCAAGRLKLGEMIEETHAPTEAPEIYGRLIREKSFPVVQFDWSRL